MRHGFSMWAVVRRSVALALAGSAVGLATPASGHDVDGSWEAGKTASTVRWGASVAVVPDGRVVAAGGSYYADDLFSELDSAEIYDPDADAWSPLPPMPAAAYGMWSATLPSGEVLVAGGFEFHPAGITSFPQTNSWVLDPDHPEKGWRDTGPMPYGMWAPYGMNHAIVLDDGKVLVRGGIDTRSATFGLGVSDQSALYDPATDKWDVTRARNADPVRTVRGRGGAFTHVSGKEIGADDPSDVLVRFTDAGAGFGADLEGQYLEVNGRGRFFVLHVDSPDAMVVYADALADGVLPEAVGYRVGGLAPQARMPHTTVTGVAVKLRDGRVLVAGGHDQRGMDSPYAMIYTPSKGTWHEVAPMPIVPDEDLDANGKLLLGDHAGARWGPLGGLLPDGSVLVAGGQAWNGQTQGYVARDSAVRFRPSTETWEVLPARMHEIRIGGSAVPLPDSEGLLVVGGLWDELAGRTEVYDWKTRTFVVAPEFGPGADALFSGAAVALPDGDVLVLFGETGESGDWTGSDQVFRYSTQSCSEDGEDGEDGEDDEDRDDHHGH